MVDMAIYKITDNNHYVTTKVPDTNVGTLILGLIFIGVTLKYYGRSMLRKVSSICCRQPVWNLPSYHVKLMQAYH